MRAARRPGKFHSPEILDRVAEKVYRAAEAANVSIALIGGFAMQFYDSPHLTHDVDFVADKKFSVGEMKGKLAIGGERKLVEGVEVDIVVRDDKYRALYEEALDRAEFVEGVVYPVVTPEYLMAMKMATLRKKDEPHLLFLLSDVELDLFLTRDIVMRHLGPHAVDIFEGLREVAEWQKHKRKGE